MKIQNNSLLYQMENDFTTILLDDFQKINKTKNKQKMDKFRFIYCFTFVIRFFNLFYQNNHES